MMKERAGFWIKKEREDGGKGGLFMRLVAFQL
jgi:hypothetical protein